MDNPMRRGSGFVNKICLCIFPFLITSILVVSKAEADKINIKDGGEVEGIITQETNDNVIVEIKFGKITLTKDNIESINRASKEENDLLRQKWEIEKKRANKIRKYPSKKPATTEEKVKPKTPTVTKQPVKPSKPPQVAKPKPERQPGKISIVRCNDNIHSYAVCLPSDYEDRGKCSVLFCFDPGGDGAGAVRRFAFAAEKYGWIVVGSLDAKNGPWEPILKAQEAMLEDIKKRYNVDRKRYYAAGFSGGARMSYTIAYKHPSHFKGVIACSAGFGQGSISKEVAVYHCVGQTDSNMDEVKKAHTKLKRKHVMTHLNIFSGGHSWPPDNVIREAVNWIASH